MLCFWFGEFFNSGSTAAAVWHQLTVKEAEAGMVAADVLAVWRLEERLLLIACRLVKLAVVCQTVGSLSQTKDLESLRVPISCVDFPVVEATDGGLKCFIGVMIGL